MMALRSGNGTCGSSRGPGIEVEFACIDQAQCHQPRERLADGPDLKYVFGCDGFTPVDVRPPAGDHGLEAFSVSYRDRHSR